MNANKPLGCKEGEVVSKIRRPVILGNTVFKQQRLGERLIFSIPWPKSDGDSQDLLRVQASYITERDYKFFEDVADRITLIGASYGASHDLHLTPLGLMPGTIGILNAIKSLSLFDQITPPPLYIRLAFLLSFITVLSYVFSRYSNIIKFLIVTALVVIFFVPISFWFFKYGVWFDFGILLLGIKLQHTLSEFLEVRELKRLKSRMQEIEQASLAKTDSPSDVSRGIVPDITDQSARDEMEVRVRLKRKKDGSYHVEATPEGQSAAEFELGQDGLKEKADGYVLDLKRTNPS